MYSVKVVSAFQNLSMNWVVSEPSPALQGTIPAHLHYNTCSLSLKVKLNFFPIEGNLSKHDDY